jgi:hypothetical protein
MIPWFASWAAVIVAWLPLYWWLVVRDPAESAPPKNLRPAISAGAGRVRPGRTLYPRFRVRPGRTLRESFMRFSFPRWPAGLLSNRVANVKQTASTLLTGHGTLRSRLAELEDQVADLEDVVHCLRGSPAEVSDTADHLGAWPPPGYPPSRHLHLVRMLAALTVRPCARSPP